MAKKAKIYSYSIVYSAAENFKDKTPYVVAVVEDDARKYLTRIEGYDSNMDIQVGMEVECINSDKELPIFKFM